MIIRYAQILGICAPLVLAACSEPENNAAATPVDTAASQPAKPIPIQENPERNAYFGDLHVHTQYSFDAFVFGTRATPDEAYEFAKGNGIEHAAGFEMKLKRPLDFQSVTDHGTYLGMLPAMFSEGSAVYDHPVATSTREAASSSDPVVRRGAFNALLPRIGGQLTEPDDLLDRGIVKSAWQDIIASAERYNDPGRFTTFIGYEYTTSGPEFENLHRNVIFEGSRHPELPYSRLESTNPEDLWDWLDDLRGRGIEGMAIPHNPNGSNGWMFQSTDWAGKPITAAYAEQRMRNEPLVENTQVKGTSDTHPLLSPNDEWADFEIMPVRIATDMPSKPGGSYVREAYLNGLLMEVENGFNPYRFGVIGSSDTHNAAGSFEEDRYWSKTGLLDATPQLRGSVPLDEPAENGDLYLTTAANHWGASGLAGVWAEANTREAIYAAFRRKETFSTSGPYIQIRFFGGYEIPEDVLTRTDAVSALYQSATTMGGDLTPRAERAPLFFVWAAQDANSAPLQRLQIVKGWVAAGQTEERVFDIACSDGLAVDPKTHRCPDNGASVDLKTCERVSTGDRPSAGAAELKTLWQDPDYRPQQHAFYYVRALENPTCRWSSWDAVRAGTPLRPDMQATIQERAWSSPIWIRP